MSAWLQTLYRQLKNWNCDDEGQGLTEYALILALIALVAIVALTLVGGDVTSQLNSVGSSIPS